MIYLIFNLFDYAVVFISLYLIVYYKNNIFYSTIILVLSLLWNLLGFYIDKQEENIKEKKLNLIMRGIYLITYLFVYMFFVL